MTSWLNSSTMASHTWGMKLQMVLSGTLKPYMRILQVSPVTRYLKVMATFKPTDNALWYLVSCLFFNMGPQWSDELLEHGWFHLDKILEGLDIVISQFQHQPLILTQNTSPQKPRLDPITSLPPCKSLTGCILCTSDGSIIALLFVCLGLPGHAEVGDVDVCSGTW